MQRYKFFLRFCQLIRKKKRNLCGFASFSKRIRSICVIRGGKLLQGLVQHEIDLVLAEGLLEVGDGGLLVDADVLDAEEVHLQLGFVAGNQRVDFEHVALQLLYETFAQDIIWNK